MSNDLNRVWTLDALKELHDRQIDALRSVTDERDRRYSDRFSAQENAVAKAEAAQAAYNVRSNEFRASLDDQGKQMLRREEADQRFHSMRELIDKNTEQINILFRGESKATGGEAAIDRRANQARWIIGLVVTCALAVGLNILGIIVALIYFLASKP